MSSGFYRSQLSIIGFICSYSFINSTTESLRISRQSQLLTSAVTHHFSPAGSFLQLKYYNNQQEFQSPQRPYAGQSYAPPPYNQSPQMPYAGQSSSPPPYNQSPQMPYAGQSSSPPPHDAAAGKESAALVKKLSYAAGGIAGMRIGSTALAGNQPGAMGVGGGGVGFLGMAMGLGYGFLMTKLRMGKVNNPNTTPMMHGTNPNDRNQSLFPICMGVLCVVGILGAIVWVAVCRIRSGETDLDRYKRKYYKQQEEKMNNN